MIVWEILVIHLHESLYIRHVRIITCNCDLVPMDLIPLINTDTHEVALMAPITGVHVDCAAYPYVC